MHERLPQALNSSMPGRTNRDHVRRWRTHARKDVMDAIERLQTFEKLLTRKIDAAG
jgi:hypothetical protein